MHDFGEMDVSVRGSILIHLPVNGKTLNSVALASKTVLAPVVHDKSCANRHLCNGYVANLAIQLASAGGHVKIVGMLLSCEDVDATTNDNQAIINASENGHVDIVRMLMEFGLADPCAKQCASLRLAAWNCQDSVVALLLADGRVDLFNELIHAAFERGHLEVVKTILLSRQITGLLLPERLSELRNTFRNRVGRRKGGEAKTATVPVQVDPTLFLTAIAKGNFTTVDSILSKQLVDPSNDCDWAIRCASELGHLEIVNRLLKDKRVDPSTYSNYSIRYAAQKGHLDVVKLLTDQRVDPSTNNNYAFRFASRNGHFDVVAQLLCDKRVDSRANDNYVMRYSSRYRHWKMAKQLGPNALFEVGIGFRSDPVVSASALMFAGQRGSLGDVQHLWSRKPSALSM
ncbi:UNVERIFIED_CONTAM: hypothetical protein HDU68_010354 [Siphonaria sp. JEL0065]|nr:hypothetical protein HDU68_010354 [Siphonaria sp. JEL0065]